MISLALNSKSFERKTHVNRRFNIDSFQMFAIPRGFQALTVLEITLALVCVIKAVPNDGKDKENTRNSNGGNSSNELLFLRPI